MKSERPMIILAETEEAIRDSIELILLDEGYDCHPVSDAASLIRAVDMHDSRLILADISMVSDERETFFETLNRYSDSPPLLIMLSYERLRDMLELTGYGVSEFIIKPFQFEELLSRIHRLIETDIQE